MAEGIRTLAEIRTPVSTNSLMALERHYKRFGWAPAARLFANRFAEEERAPIMRALEAHSTAIQTELETGA
jgi:hypothetical protein